MKRERIDDDDPDVMPLSKRMNNIHFGGVSNQGGGGSSYGPGLGSSVNINGHVGMVNGHRENGVDMFQHPATSGSTNTGFCNNPVNGNMSTNGGEGTSSRMVPEICDNRMMQMQNVQYNPALNRDQNPIYYDQNRMLFELYKERLSRLDPTNFSQR